MEYVRVSTNELDWRRVVAPIIKALVGLLFQIMIFLSFNFASKSSNNMNSGVVSSLFTSNVVFTSIFFYIFFNQKLSRSVLTGMFFIILCAVLISTEKSGKGSESSNGDEQKGENWYGHLTVIVALGAGLTLTMLTLLIKTILV